MDGEDLPNHILSCVALGEVEHRDQIPLGSTGNLNSWLLPTQLDSSGIPRIRLTFLLDEYIDMLANPFSMDSLTDLSLNGQQLVQTSLLDVLGHIILEPSDRRGAVGEYRKMKLFLNGIRSMSWLSSCSEGKPR